VVIRQGELYWMTFEGRGSEPAGRRPAIVVQHDRFNRSAVRTTVVAAITSNLRLAAAPGNVRLQKGEASLPRPSVVNVSLIRTVDKSRLTHRIGAVSAKRMTEILAGVGLVLGIDATAE
jgi:mRNA interferase MazF